MALPIDAREIHPELASFQAGLTPGELYRAEAVFERLSQVRVNGDGQHAGSPVISSIEGHAPIYRVDNKANSVQSSLTILYQSEGGPIEEPTTEVVLLGAFRTDQLDQAVKGFKERGYQFPEAEEIV